MNEEWTRDVLEQAAQALRDTRPILSANLYAVADEVIGRAVEIEGCLHYDYPPSRKMKGELVCGGCSIIFGYWRDPPVTLYVKGRPW